MPELRGLPEVLGNRNRGVELRPSPIHVSEDAVCDAPAVVPLAELFPVIQPLGDDGELAREPQAFVDRVGSNDRSGPTVERVGERGRAPGSAGELDRFAAQGVAAVARMLVAERAGQPREQPRPYLYVFIRNHLKALLEQRNELRVRPGPAPHVADAVSGRRLRELVR